MIAVIDYGMGNLRSVGKALEKAGSQVSVTSDFNEIARASAVVLPGVGAFHRAVENLKKMGIWEVLIESITKGLPFFGICLGLQLLFTESEEGNASGLNMIKGKVKRFIPSSKGVKVPHMGWNQVELTANSQQPAANIFKGIPDNSFFYFAHSYYVVPEDKGVVCGTTEYEGEFVSAVQKENVFGIQFHPEKSGGFGIKILKNFLTAVNK